MVNNSRIKGYRHKENCECNLCLGKAGFQKGHIPYNKGKHLSEETKKLIRLNHANVSGKNNPMYGRKGKNHPKYGKYPTEETKKLMSESKIGEKNSMFGRLGELCPSWLGGKSFEPYDKHFNNLFKRAIRKRDNQICMLCGIHREKLNKTLDIHHINYDKILTIPQNCISLCGSCHSKTNHNRKHWTNFFQSLLTERYNYQYSKTEEIIFNLNDTIKW